MKAITESFSNWLGVQLIEKSPPPQNMHAAYPGGRIGGQCFAGIIVIC
jgi:hypothetical protein